MDRTIVSTPEAPAALGPYNQAVRAGGLVFTSGQIGLVPGTTDVAGDGVAEQTEQVLRNLDAILKAAGTSRERVVKTTVYLSNMEDFSTMNEVYGRFFDGEAPARATVAVKTLPMHVRVAIDAIALAG